ncbi:DNA ligase I [Xylogone sp. PMI_703]|nr:DNA ligase I [Xylogone sp. PMI_703]
MANRRNSKTPSAEAIEEDERQYGGPESQEELDQKYPNRPHNHSRTLPFHELYISLFNPLSENKKRPTGPTAARAKQGPHGPKNLSPHEIRRNIIVKFMTRWRNEVGDDFYPALRLIIPEKDRDRAMYGMKEATIAKVLVKVLKLDRHSEDATTLLKWKLPGTTAASRVAGDFGGRCYEVLLKRQMRSDPGDMRIGEVNELLDKLSMAQKEDQQQQIFETFYGRMNATEMMWLIRIILRQMKVGATEKTFLELWHPDGEALFSVSSSLRRVCWELTDPSIRLEGDEAGISLMQCYQPQLAQFQMHSFQKMVNSMRPTEDDPEFWIEEKLDGERMQLHMIEDDAVPGGRRVAFWSRKAKEYTYLYGNGFEDENSALTRFIKDAFNPQVRNIILDGEMITWDPEDDIMVPFGTLKTAALSEQRNPYENAGQRPLYRVFDCLYLNDKDITKFTLRDRRKALEASIKNIHRRIEIHHYEKATDASAIEPLLKKVVAEASEGLVLKNPRSIYRLNSRNDDWLKVKPEYMTEFGESLDVLVIGGYYGSGRRGGALSSFLCGLKVSQNHIAKGAHPSKCWSFLKVGGGFRAEDYAAVRHRTEGKWIDWDPRHPPTQYIELAGGDLQYEKPDVWIKPTDSVVLEVKAASVSASDQFRTGFTLRFPRFKRLRLDKNWETALDLQEFLDLKSKVEAETKEKEFQVDTRRRAAKRVKKEIVIAGNEEKLDTPYQGTQTQVFEGLNFCVLTDMTHPMKKSKAQIEQMIKANGGNIFQSANAKDDMVVVGEKKVVKAASIMKAGAKNIVKPAWILDAVRQAEIDGMDRGRLIIPFEPAHMFHTTEESRGEIEGNVDEYGDSYTRDVDAAELKKIFDSMNLIKKQKTKKSYSHRDFLAEMAEHGDETLVGMEGWLFRGLHFFIPESSSEVQAQIIQDTIRFQGGEISSQLDDRTATHVILMDEKNTQSAKDIRSELSQLKGKIPRLVSRKWVEDCIKEKTLVDEEPYAVR